MRCSRTSATWWAASSGSKRSSPRAWIICSEPCRSPVSESRGWTSRRRTSTCPSRSGASPVPGELTAVHQQVPAQVVGDGRGLGTQGLDEDVLTRHGLQPVGEGPQRLVVQCHGPGAGHRRRHGGVGGLEGVVPVAVAVRDEGPRQDVLAGGGERALEVRAHRRGRHVARVDGGVPGHLSPSSVASPDARRYRPTARTGQWTTSPCGGSIRKCSFPRKPNAWGQVPSTFCAAKMRRSRARASACRSSASSELERTLRHVPRPPGAARELLEAARGQEVHQASRTSQGRLTASGSASGAGPTRTAVTSDHQSWAASCTASASLLPWDDGSERPRWGRP